MTARRAFYLLGTVLFWSGLLSLCYQTIFARYFFPAGLVDVIPNLVVMTAGALLQGRFYEMVLLTAVIAGLYGLSVYVWFAPLILVMAGSALLFEIWYHRFDFWRTEHRKGVLRQSEGMQLSAEGDREANRREYPLKRRLWEEDDSDL